jgi:hypothetical protein
MEEIFSNNLKSQSALEYLVTYGWALLVLGIAAVLLYYFISVPRTIASDTCTFTSTFLCSDMNVGALSSGQLLLTIYGVNQKPYAVSNVHFIVSYTGNNITTGGCFPSYVAPGGRMICQEPLSFTGFIGQFVSGNLYIQGNDCGTAPNYLISKGCTGAQLETIVGSFSGRVETPVTEYAYVTDNSALPNTAGLYIQQR